MIVEGQRPTATDLIGAAVAVMGASSLSVSQVPASSHLQVDHLTSCHAARTIESMHRILRRRARAVGAALAVLFVGTLSATCLLQAEMTAPEMACCASMTSDCGAAMAQKHRCCEKTSPRIDAQLAAASRLLVASPTLTPSTILACMFDEAGIGSIGVVARSSDSSPPGSHHPTYLVLSVFRI